MSLGGSQHTGKYFFLIVGLHLISKAVFVWKQNNLEWNITIIKKLGFVSLVLKLIFLYFPVGSFMCCLPRQTNQPEGLLKKCFPGREDCYENWSLSLVYTPRIEYQIACSSEQIPGSCNKLSRKQNCNLWLPIRSLLYLSIQYFRVNIPCALLGDEYQRIFGLWVANQNILREVINSLIISSYSNNISTCSTCQLNQEAAGNALFNRRS